MQHDLEQPPSAEVVQQGYEPDAVNSRGLLWFVIVFISTAIVLHIGLWVLLKYYMGQERPEAAPKSAAPMVDRHPEPNLQPSPPHNRLPRDDLAALRQSEAQLLERLGWTADPRTGDLRVPADIAAEMSRRYPGRTPRGGPATSPSPSSAPGSPPGGPR